MRPVPFCLSLVTLLTAAILAGCNIVGPVMVLAQGPPKTDAQYELESGRTFIVLIDDMNSRMPKRSLRDLMGSAAEETLLAEKVLGESELIGGRAVQRAMTDDRSGKPKSIVEIGREAGADVVIHVSIAAWGLSQDGRSAAPYAEGYVKVIDCTANRRLWPNIENGYLLRVRPEGLRGDGPTDLASKTKLEQDLARRFGVSIAQLFYKHETASSAKQ